MRKLVDGSVPSRVSPDSPVAPPLIQVASETESELLNKLTWVEGEIASNPRHFGWLAARSVLNYQLRRFDEATQDAEASIAAFGPKDATFKALTFPESTAHAYRCLSLCKLQRAKEFLQACQEWSDYEFGAHAGAVQLIEDLIRMAKDPNENEVLRKDANELLTAVRDLSKRLGITATTELWLADAYLAARESQAEQRTVRMS